MLSVWFAAMSTCCQLLQDAPQPQTKPNYHVVRKHHPVHSSR